MTSYYDPTTEQEAPLPLPPFDKVAAQYDADFTDTPLGRRQRGIVQRYLQQVVQPRYRVLELNCGTGEDALWLAGHAAEVIATDISEEMLNVARMKAEQSTANAPLSFRQLDIASLRSTDVAGLGTFDLILSDFDGLNCLRDIAWFPDALKRLLNPGGHVVLVFMNPICGMEILASLASGHFRRAFTRLRRKGTSAHIGSGSHVQTYFHPVGRALRTFAADYTIRRVEAVGLITPPTLLRDFYHRHEHAFARLHPLEDAFTRIPPFNRLGDHVLIHAQLNND